MKPKAAAAAAEPDGGMFCFICSSGRGAEGEGGCSVSVSYRLQDRSLSEDGGVCGESHQVRGSRTDGHGEEREKGRERDTTLTLTEGIKKEKEREREFMICYEKDYKLFTTQTHTHERTHTRTHIHTPCRYCVVLYL